MQRCVDIVLRIFRGQDDSSLEFIRMVKIKAKVGQTDYRDVHGLDNYNL